MNLFLLRHGLAVEGGGLDYAHDCARPLTLAGRSQLHQIAAALRVMALRFDVILSSPLVRAQETAGVVAAALKIKTEPVEVDELKPSGDKKSSYNGSRRWPRRRKTSCSSGTSRI